MIKLHLEARDIEMELLPPGMERTKSNQSFWDFKNKVAMLTIEFKLHAPANVLTPSKDTPFIMLTHRNDMNTPPLTLIRKHISTAKKNNNPSWTKSLVLPDTDSPESFTMPYFVMRVPRDVCPTAELITRPGRPVYYRFDPVQPLFTQLKDTRFVEFPTIEICEEFNGTVVDAAGITSHVGEEQPRAKRRKLTSRTSRVALSGLLGGYGSGEDEQVEVPDKTPVLVEYTDSVSEEETEMSRGESSGLEERDEEDVRVDPATLLELLHEARNSGKWTQDEDVDWGEDSEGDT